MSVLLTHICQCRRVYFSTDDNGLYLSWIYRGTPDSLLGGAPGITYHTVERVTGYILVDDVDIVNGDTVLVHLWHYGP